MIIFLFLITTAKIRKNKYKANTYCIYIINTYFCSLNLNLHNIMENKKTKTFRFSEKTIFLLEKIAEKEQRNLTNALEVMVLEKSQFYGIKYFKKIPPYTGVYDDVKKDNPFDKL